jgi:circadian clock protein KaiC
VELRWQAPTEDIMDALAHRLLDAVRRRGVRRLVVDGLGGFIETAVQPHRITRFFAALSNELRALGATTIYTLETRDVVGSTMQMPVSGVSSLVENLIFLRYVEYRAEVHRVLSVLKVRTSSFDPRLREFEIDERGIRLADTFESARKLLSGTAEEAPAPRQSETRRTPPRGTK